ncbi:phosphotransferase [Tabrizicola sp.]|uniref:aminoglycoside phosphotransferase family protein n=1 Tax=Tabrizicola sp. TaxID=2005166 RepID=UPI00286CF3B1|nr:phosphotransferase [Tabrizicola sp.]
MPDRAIAAQSFIAAAGWAAAERRHLAGDASDRSYQRLTLAGRSAVLMDSPPGTGDDPASFVHIAGHLRDLGLSAPAILEQDLARGFLLLEDLGDSLFARLLKDGQGDERELYTAATDVLLHLQRHPAPTGLANLDAGEWAQAAAVALEWYAFGISGQCPDPARFVATLADMLSRHADGPRVLILRDYHAENLIWLPDRQGLARVGLLDFQLAQMGQPAYDLVSLLQDARRDVSLATEKALTLHFSQNSMLESAPFQAAYAAIGAQRALRILGIFARLCIVAGKPAYVRLIPRVWGQLQRNLAHPGLAALRAICDDLLPPPTPAALGKIEGLCNSQPPHF